MSEDDKARRSVQYWFRQELKPLPPDGIMIHGSFRLSPEEVERLRAACGANQEKPE